MRPNSGIRHKTQMAEQRCCHNGDSSCASTAEWNRKGRGGRARGTEQRIAAQQQFKYSSTQSSAIYIGGRTTRRWSAADFHYQPCLEVSESMRRGFDENGYVIFRNLLSQEELQKLKSAIENDEGVMKYAYGRDDGAGMRTRTALWNQPGNDITGVIARSQKMAGTFEALLGGEVYHYHSKVIMKNAGTGGSHVWHQDYGYWYENGCLTPDMGTTWIALDRAHRGNGCLQVLVGSHRLGRVHHVPVGEQVGADLERVAQAQKLCPPIYVELEPGDAIFFHSNLLHTSAQNHSSDRRWAFLVAYNRADNDPVYKHHHPQYTKLHKVPDSAILECSTETNMEGKDFFLGPKADFSLKKVKDVKS